MKLSGLFKPPPEPQAQPTESPPTLREVLTSGLLEQVQADWEAHVNEVKEDLIPLVREILGRNYGVYNIQRGESSPFTLPYYTFNMAGATWEYYPNDGFEEEKEPYLYVKYPTGGSKRIKSTLDLYRILDE